MKRRGFLAGILAAGMAPAIVHNPMKIWVPSQSVVLLTEAERIQAIVVGKLRDLAYNLYRESGYSAAAAAVGLGVVCPDTIYIPNDPILLRYLGAT